MNDDLDLTAAAVPARRVRLPAGAIQTLGFGELLEVGRLTGHPYAELSRVLRAEDTGAAALIAVALAFVLARRLEPGVTWDEAQRWIVEVIPQDPPTPDTMTGPRS